jgi:glycosyltransferase involved in cell wall biosynthesis
VAETARKRPTWQFHIVGFGEPVPIKLPENVQLLGRVPHHLLPSYARNWDVAMVPFKSNAIGRSADPIKVYEYLALGLPVVSGNLPQLASYPGVRVAASNDEFALLLERAAREGLDLAAVRAFLEQSSWQRRSVALLAAAREK